MVSRPAGIVLRDFAGFRSGVHPAGMPPPRDTIFALSSGRPPAAIAVVRLSGPRAGDALKALAGKIPEPRKAALARVRDPQSGEMIDEALALWFPGPRSETGEDMAELQLHGGRAVVAAVFAALSPHRWPADGGARRVHPARVRERPSRPHCGRGPGRPDLRRNRGAAAPGLPAAQGVFGRPGRDLAQAADRGAGAGRGADRFLRRGRRAGGAGRPGAEDCCGACCGNSCSIGRGRTRRAAARRAGGRDRWARRTPASRPCSTASPGARLRSYRRSPAPPAT